MPVKLLDSRLLLNTYYVILYTNPDVVFVLLINFTVQSYNIKY